MFDKSKTNDSAQNEKVYIAAYTIIKRMLNEGVIGQDVFARLNEKIASVQGCVSFSH